MKKITDLHIGLDEDLAEKLEWLVPNYSSYHILKKSLDARRRKAAPEFVYSLEVFEQGELPKEPDFELGRVTWKGAPVLIVGSGPAGLFAALRLSERGIPAVVFEQGAQTKERIFAISRYWRHGELNSRSNVGFGEGGAGLYSDGKLITRIKSPFIPYVMDRLVRFGAPAEIRFLSNPHVGSDKIRRIIPVMRARLEELGAKLHFNTKVTKLLTEGKRIVGLETEAGESFRSDHVILACGHSAEDMFRHLFELGVQIEGKSFAVGLRVEHPQSAIDKMQYREHAGHPKLEAANYKLAHTDEKSGIGVYSFCMCPGGYVLASATDPGSVVSNGMSNFARSSGFANAAVVVSVDYQKNFGVNPGAGLDWRRHLEERAYSMVLEAGGSGKELPAQTLTGFIRGSSDATMKSSSPSGIVASRLDELLGPNLRREFLRGLENFDRWMKGFISDEAQLFGIESRTSCPIRINRDPKTLESISHGGLFPAGEGAGYAGGITSAACDGIRIADLIAGFSNSEPLE